jgi:hypothetical protein
VQVPGPSVIDALGLFGTLGPREADPLLEHSGGCAGADGFRGAVKGKLHAVSERTVSLKVVRHEARRRVQQDRVPDRPGFAGQDIADDGGIRLCVTAAQLINSGLTDPQVPGARKSALSLRRRGFPTRWMAPSG